MTVLRNNFEGGPDGTTISVANSSQSGGDPFDQVSTSGTGTVVKYASADGLDRPTAEYVMRFATGSSTSVWPGVRYSTSMGSRSQIWTRFYIYLTALSTSPGFDFNIFSATNNSVNYAVAVYVRTTTPPLSLAILNGRNNATSVVATPITLSEWHRVEFRATMHTSTGSADLKYFSGQNVDTDIVTDQVSQTSQNYGATSFEDFKLGSGWTAQANTPNTYFSNWELNDTGYPGPAPFRAGKGYPGILANPIAIHTD
jgi:hypothetical protein